MHLHWHEHILCVYSMCVHYAWRTHPADRCAWLRCSTTCHHSDVAPQGPGLCRVKSGGHTLVLVVCWSVHTHAHRTSHNHCLSMVVVFTSRKPRMVSVKTYDVLHELERQKDSGGSWDERMFLGILVASRRKSKEGVIRGWKGGNDWMEKLTLFVLFV